ncbi:MAG: hypothetical protein RLZZ528_1918, partial [Pseudomonadota bacterium]
ISEDDLALFRYAETAEEAMATILAWEVPEGRRSKIPGR